MLREYTVGRADMANLVREVILEQVRKEEFPDKPSRFEAAFVLPTLEAARYFHTHNQPFGLICEVDLVEPDKPVHEGDFNLVQPKPGQPWLSGMADIAQCYWRGERSTITDEQGQPVQTDCRELVICSPLRILSLVDEP